MASGPSGLGFSCSLLLALLVEGLGTFLEGVLPGEVSNFKAEGVLQLVLRDVVVAGGPGLPDMAARPALGGALSCTDVARPLPIFVDSWAQRC